MFDSQFCVTSSNTPGEPWVVKFLLACYINSKVNVFSFPLSSRFKTLKAQRLIISAKQNTQQQWNDYRILYEFKIPHDLLVSHNCLIIMAIYNYSPTSICDHLLNAITIPHKRLACDRLESFRSIKQFESSRRYRK